MIVPASALYRESGYRTGLILALLTLAVPLTLEMYWLPWGWHAGKAGWLMLAVVVAYGIGQWFETLPNIIRLVSGILDGIRAGNATDAICDAITKRGEPLLASQPCRVRRQSRRVAGQADTRALIVDLIDCLPLFR